MNNNTKTRPVEYGVLFLAVSLLLLVSAPNACQCFADFVNATLFNCGYSTHDLTMSRTNLHALLIDKASGGHSIDHSLQDC